MKRTLLLIGGWVMLALGAVGIIIPVLPTTPFVLVAAGCFSFASPRLYGILCRNRFFGPYIENYRTKQGVPMAAKVRGIAVLWALLVVSMVSMQKQWLTLLLLAVGTAVTVHLLMLKTRASGAIAEEIEAPEMEQDL